MTAGAVGSFEEHSDRCACDACAAMQADGLRGALKYLVAAVVALTLVCGLSFESCDVQYDDEGEVDR